MQDNGVTQFLHHGEIAAMVSDPSGGLERSFQRLYEHAVPKRKKGALKEDLRGWRLSLTIRLQTQGQFVFKSEITDHKYRTVRLEDGIQLRLWTPGSVLTTEEVTVLRDELLDQIKTHGVIDRTYFMGKWHTNGGRTVLELAKETGLTYKYGGKTTPPGQAFGPVLRKMLTEKLGPAIFGTNEADFWAHLVYYPTPTDCGLAWHSDTEYGIDPHCIASITFLEDPDNGARPFQVRKKRAKK